MKKIARVLCLLVLASTLGVVGTVINDTVLKPKSALAEDVGCSGLILGAISNDQRRSTFIRVCMDWAPDGQSMRARLGVSCLLDGAPYAGCRWDISPLELLKNDGLVADDDITFPAPPGFHSGTILYGHWYNPPGSCWPDADGWEAQERQSYVRFLNGELKLMTERESNFISLNKPGC